MCFLYVLISIIMMCLSLFNCRLACLRRLPMVRVCLLCVCVCVMVVLSDYMGVCYYYY